jgi:uncharacterized membrane protein YjdF
VFGAFAAGAFELCLRLNRVPTFYSFLLVLSAIANAGGWMLDLFTRIAPYDELVHAVATMALTAVLCSAIVGPLRRDLTGHVVRFWLIIVSFGLAIGAAWEIVEWAGYKMFAPLEMKGRADTLNDLLMDAIGSAIAALMVLRTSADSGDR